MKTISLWFVIFFAACLSPVYAQMLSVVIEPEALKEIKANHNTVIIDLRTEDKYQQGHIPGAINIPFKLFNRVKDGVEGFIITPSAFKDLMQKNGIRKDQLLILYSDWAFLESARVYWALDFYGHKKKKILDGGIQLWVKKALPLEKKQNHLPESRYVFEIHPERLASKFQTFMARMNQDYLIIDARPEEHYKGIKSLTQRKGHIPKAVNLPWYQLIRNRKESDGYERLSSVSQMKALQEVLPRLKKMTKDKKVIVYCNGGMESAILFLLLRQLGTDVSLYDGSWFEWSRDPKMPVVK